LGVIGNAPLVAGSDVDYVGFFFLEECEFAFGEGSVTVLRF